MSPGPSRRGIMPSPDERKLSLGRFRPNDLFGHQVLFMHCSSRARCLHTWVAHPWNERPSARPKTHPGTRGRGRPGRGFVMFLTRRPHHPPGCGPADRPMLAARSYRGPVRRVVLSLRWWWLHALTLAAMTAFVLL